MASPELCCSCRHYRPERRGALQRQLAKDVDRSQKIFVDEASKQPSVEEQLLNQDQARRMEDPFHERWPEKPILAEYCSIDESHGRTMFVRSNRPHVAALPATTNLVPLPTVTTLAIAVFTGGVPSKERRT